MRSKAISPALFSDPALDPHTAARSKWALHWEDPWREFLGSLPAASASKFDFSFAQAFLRRAIDGISEPRAFLHLGAGFALPSSAKISADIVASSAPFWRWGDSVASLRNEWWESAPRSPVSAWVDEAMAFPSSPWIRWAACSPSAEALVPALLEAGFREPPMPRWGMLPPHALCFGEKLSEPAELWLFAAAALCGPASFCDDAEFSADASEAFSGGAWDCFHFLCDAYGGKTPSLSRSASIPATRSLASVFWMSVVSDDPVKSPFFPAASLPFAQATLSPSAAGISPEAPANWPLETAIWSEPYQCSNPAALRMFDLGADPNAFGLGGLRMWQLPAEPFSETGTEGNVSILMEKDFQLWFDRGADFSLPYRGEPLSSFWRRALRPWTADEESARALRWERASRARAEKALLDEASGPPSLAGTRSKSL